jgi:hypothetical protein
MVRKSVWCVNADSYWGSKGVVVGLIELEVGECYYHYSFTAIHYTIVHLSW